MYCLNAKAEKKRPAGNLHIGQESNLLAITCAVTVEWRFALSVSWSAAGIRSAVSAMTTTSLIHA